MIKEKIIQVVEFTGIEKELFYQKIGMTSASFRGKAKETPINSNAIENILLELPDVNPIWLLTGKGQMILDNTDAFIAKEDIIDYKTIQTPSVVTVDNHGHDNVVLVPIKAAAGYLNGYDDPNFIEKLPTYNQKISSRLCLGAEE